MKNEFLKIQWGFLLILIAIVAQTSCISDNSNPALLPDPDTDLEIVTDETSVNPLENLRMNPEMLKMLSDIRKATARFHRIEVAQESGYAQGSPCVAHPTLGAMGFHYVNFRLVDDEFDPNNPEAVLYELTENGKMRLVAVEFIIDAASWDEENDDVPYFGDLAFDDHRDFLTMGGPQFPHYQLHAWVWKNNPSGIFTKFNPNVKCGNN